MDEHGIHAVCREVYAAFPGREAQIATLATLLDPALAPPRSIVVHGTEATGKSAVTAAVLAALAAPPAPAAVRGDESPDGPDASPLLDYAIIGSNKCVTARHLFERTVALAAEGLHCAGGPRSRRCESLAQLAVELAKLVEGRPHPDRHAVLVFDGIDFQRDAPATLLPGLARLSETIRHLTTVFIVTFPSPAMLRTSAAPHIHFTNYTKAEFVAIQRRTPLPPSASSSTATRLTPDHATAEEEAELWARFCAAVHDALAKTAGRTLPTYRDVCAALWPRFTAPIVAGTHGVREFSKLLIAARAHFQDESLLDPTFVVAPAVQPKTAAAAAGAAGLPPPAPETPTAAAAAATTTRQSSRGRPAAASAAAAAAAARPAASDAPVARHLASLLPVTPRLFLLCAYLASHNAPKHDLTLFSTYHHGRKRRRGGGGARPGPRSKHRKIARKLLGAHAFPLERLLAIFAAVRGEWTRAPQPAAAAAAAAATGLLDGDGLTALATLAALRLVVRVGAGGGDPLDRAARWRVNVGWEVVRSLGRTMGVEMEEWLID